LKTLKLFYAIALITMLLLSAVSVKAQDSMKVLTEYSLFFEYHKNKDYQSAMPHGWEVINLNPSRFKNVYSKMEDALWYLHDSTNISDEEKKQIADTTKYLYNLAIQHVPVNAAYYQVRKAFIMENWLVENPDSVIAAYEKAMSDTSISSFYRDRLGLLYIKNATDNNDYKIKALELYSNLSEKEPNNPAWNQRLEGLAENIDQLVGILAKAWEMDKDNIAKAWKYASAAIKAADFKQAIIPLEFLVQKDPKVLNYWNQLALAYHKTEQLDKALDAYRKVIEIDPKNREAYMNSGIIYREKGQLAQARTNFQKAVDASPGWGYPVFLEATLYEQAARNCGFEWMDKLVYLLAQDTYRRAKNMDQSIAAQAQERINALSGSVPTKEDYFFRQVKSGQSVSISGNCYGWIGKSVTIP